MKSFISNNYLLIVLIAVLLSIYLFIQNTDNNADEIELSKFLIVRKEFYQAYLDNESTKLKNVELYLGDDTLHAHNLYDIIDGSILVFYFSENMCGSCLRFILESIASIFPNYATNEKIVFIGSGIKPRSRSNFFGKEIFWYKEEGSGIKFEEKNQAFFYRVENEMKVEMFFMPDKNFPEQTLMYLKNID